MSTLPKLALQVDPTEVAIMTVSQFLFGLAWFHVIVHHFETYYLAADKGVRRVEHVVHRYPTAAVYAVDLLSSVVRSVVLLTLLTLTSSITLVDYQYVAIAVAIASLITTSRHFAYQRPFPLFVSQWCYEMAASMTAALVCFYVRRM